MFFKGGDTDIHLNTTTLEGKIKKLKRKMQPLGKSKEKICSWHKVNKQSSIPQQ